MDVDVLAMLDRVERLAFQAGLGAGGKTASPTPAEPTLTQAEKEVLRKLRAASKYSTGYTGVLAYATKAEDNLTWEEVHALNQ